MELVSTRAIYRRTFSSGIQLSNKLFLVSVINFLIFGGGTFAKGLSELELLGKKVFFDTELSEPAGQSCATCHNPDQAFANNMIVHPGADPKMFAQRNTPALSYVSYTPAFKYETIEGNVVPVGGLFWDGRVNDLTEQSLRPFVNPLEMGNKSLSAVYKKVTSRPYFTQLINPTKNSAEDERLTLEALKTVLKTYQSSSEFNKFNSKFDLWLDKKVTFSSLESMGKIVFERVDKGNCAACHKMSKTHSQDHPLLTDFTYDNIGVPKNPDNPFYLLPSSINPAGGQFVDYGLGMSERMKDQNYLGMFKVPTLRNIALTAPYMHNGVFKSLREVVEFYNSRDLQDKWGKPEVGFNVNTTELGNLSLTEMEIDALVAFMNTFTDNYEK